MLRFKQFIDQFLSEAKIEHFSHLGLDPNNPEHKDLVDAYNLGHSKNDSNVPRQPNQIKTFDQLKNSVASHMAEIQKKRQEDKETQEAIQKGHASLEHDDKESGVRVYNIRNQAGGWAVGQRAGKKDSGWCTSDKPNEEGETGMVGRYDQEGGNSHVIHLDKEKAPFKKIGIFGKYEGDEGETANFQDQGNRTISKEKWDELRRKHGLDNIPALWGVRGITMPEDRKKEYSDKLSEKIKNGTHDSFDLAHAQRNGYLNDEHERLLPDGLMKKIQAGTHTSRDLDHAYENGYFNDEHKRLLAEVLTKKIEAGTHTIGDLNHAYENRYFNDEHKNLLPGALTKKIQAGTHTSRDLNHAKIFGYFNDDHKKLLGK